MAPKQKKPLLDEKSKDLATLSTLRRSDPHVTEILGTASHVTLYGFDIDISAWSRKNVEGSLFVVRRSVEPIFQFVVLNRLSAENTVENLLGDFEFERSPPYLLYKNETEVNGIWFYKQEECDAMSELFNKITNAFGPKAPHTGMSVETALATMELGTALASAAPAPGPAALAPVAAHAPVVDPREDSVAAFFAAASSGGAVSSATNGAPPGYAAPAPVPVAAAAPVAPKEKARAKKEKEKTVSVVSDPAPSPPGSQSLNRDVVRAAMYKLVSNDTFIDMMVKELKQSM